MINKISKTIHNKFSRFFRFIFFLRYLFGLFLVSIILFLLIPYFFDYEKRSEIFKKYLEENYNFKISKYEKIEFKALPIPKIEYKNVQCTINTLKWFLAGFVCRGGGAREFLPLIKMFMLPSKNEICP